MIKFASFFSFSVFLAVLFSSSRWGPTDEQKHIDLTGLYTSANINQGSESEIGPLSWAEDPPKPNSLTPALHLLNIRKKKKSH